MLKNKRKFTPEEQALFNLYSDYESLAKGSEFISFSKFFASVLLKINIGFQSKEFKHFESEIKQAFETKRDLIFRDFIINFNVVLKFSANVLVPTIANSESSNDLAFVFTKSEDPNYQLLLDAINESVKQLLEANYRIELFPNTILFIDRKSSSLKILFDKSIVARI